MPWSDTAQRMSNIEGRKAILLIASGRDTFSKLTYDKARKAVQEAGVPIYAVSMLQAMRIMAEQYMGNIQQHGFSAGRQRDEDLRRRERRPSLLPALLRRVSRTSSRASHTALRNQYSITYGPPIKPRTASSARSKWSWWILKPALR